jgi:hypothetical protein
MYQATTSSLAEQLATARMSAQIKSPTALFGKIRLFQHNEAIWPLTASMIAR